MITLEQLVTVLGGRLLHTGKDSEFSTVRLVSRLSSTKSLSAKSIVVTARPERWGKYFDDSSDQIQFFDELGAGVVIVDKEPQSALGNSSASVILVPDTRGVLRKLAHFQRLRSGASVTAITGSAGKTTTKEMLASATEKTLRTFKSPFTSNTALEVFVNIFNTPSDTEHAIYELGIEGPDSIWGKSIATRPDCAIITSLGPAHVGKFSDMKHLAATKAEVFYGLALGGCVFVSDQCEEFGLVTELVKIRPDIQLITYGLSSNSDIFIENVERNSNCSHVSASFFGTTLSFNVPPFRPHLELNALAVVARSAQLGVPQKLVFESIERFAALDGRSQIIPLSLDGKDFQLVDDSFNANLTSLEAGFRTLQMLDAKKRIAVLGEMAELGKFSDEAHDKLADLIKEFEVDHIICTGEAMQSVVRACGSFATAEYHTDLDELSDRVLHAISEKSAVLIKGSNSNRLTSVVQMLKRRCTD